MNTGHARQTSYREAKSTLQCALDKKRFVQKNWGGGRCSSSELQMYPQWFPLKKDLKQILYYSIYLKYFILKNSWTKFKDATTLRLGCQSVDSTWGLGGKDCTFQGSEEVKGRILSGTEVRQEYINQQGRTAMQTLDREGTMEAPKKQAIIHKGSSWFQ